MIRDEEKMKALIYCAKKQVLEWYNPETPREFIKTEIWSASREHPGESGELTELYILEGGEPKGTIIADYYNGVVIAYDRCHKNTITLRTTQINLNQEPQPSKNLCLGDPEKFRAALKEFIEENREGLIRLGRS